MKGEHFDVKENIERWYPEHDFHTMYMAEIVKVLVKEFRIRISIMESIHK